MIVFNVVFESVLPIMQQRTEVINRVQLVLWNKIIDIFSLIVVNAYLNGSLVNLFCHSTHGGSLKFTCTVP